MSAEINYSYIRYTYTRPVTPTLAALLNFYENNIQLTTNNTKKIERERKSRAAFDKRFLKGGSSIFFFWLFELEKAKMQKIGDILDQDLLEALEVKADGLSNNISNNNNGNILV